MNNRIKELRKARGISLTHLCRLTGISRTYLYKVEQGTCDVSITKAGQIAKYLGVPIEEVFDLPNPDDWKQDLAIFCQTHDILTLLTLAQKRQLWDWLTRLHQNGQGDDT